MIIGLTGSYCAGKGEAANFFISKSFIFYSLSDVIREELRKENIEITRENLINKANELRSKFGLSVLAKRVIEKFRPKKDYVIDSIRNPEEVKALKEGNNFMLLNIQAPLELRFQRLINRKERKETDAKTLEEFKANEAREMKSSNPANQQIRKCIEMSDITIRNDATIESFHKKLEKALKNAK